MKVKKIIAALLASVCVFSFFSCVKETTSSEWVSFKLNKDKRTYAVSGCAYCEAAADVCYCDCHYEAKKPCKECSNKCVVAERDLYVDRYHKWPVENIAMNAFTADSNTGKKSCMHIHKLEMSDYLLSIEKFAFSGCQNLETVVLGKNLSTIGESAFAGCTSLSTLVLNDKYTVIKSKTFSDCTSLTVLDLTNVTAIDAGAFKGCTSLQYVILGYDITKMGQDAFFFDDDNPVDFYFLGSATDWAEKVEAYEIVNKNEKKFIHSSVNTMISPYIIYYSYDDPMELEDYHEDNRYWYYDDDGVPALW